MRIVECLSDDCMTARETAEHVCVTAALNIRRSGMDALISGSKPTSVAAMSESRIPLL